MLLFLHSCVAFVFQPFSIHLKFTTEFRISISKLLLLARSCVFFLLLLLFPLRFPFTHWAMLCYIVCVCGLLWNNTKQVSHSLSISRSSLLIYCTLCFVRMKKKPKRWASQVLKNILIINSKSSRVKSVEVQHNIDRDNLYVCASNKGTERERNVNEWNFILRTILLLWMKFKITTHLRFVLSHLFLHAGNFSFFWFQFFEL